MTWKKRKVTLEICQHFLGNPIIDNQYEILIKKRKQFYYDNYEDSEESDSYITKFKDVQKEKKIMKMK